MSEAINLRCTADSGSCGLIKGGVFELPSLATCRVVGYTARFLSTLL